MKKNFNLFVNTCRLTERKEDHLTEFFAALLLSSSEFRIGYEQLVLSRFFDKQKSLFPDDGWKDSCIVDVVTQCHFAEEKRRPDMLLKLSNGKMVACEHKIESFEASKDEEGNPNQLWAYLDLPDIAGLVYIRSIWKSPQQRVLEHPNYIKPTDCEHFLWRDFYHLMCEDGSTLGRWMKVAFEYLGYTPPVAPIGEMSGPDLGESKRNRENYKKLLANTYSIARSLGWRPESAWDEGLFCSENPKANSSQVMFSASNTDRFLVRVTPRNGQIAHVKARLEIACQEIADKLNVPTDLDEDTAVRVGNKKVPVLLLTTTLREILGKASTLPAVEGRLTAFYSTILMALQEK